MIDPEERERLSEVLEEARAKGFLGPGPVAPHLEHALGFVECIPADADVVVDLGSGGGLPGLVLAVARPLVEVRFVDAGRRRCEHLESALVSLGLEGRCTVHWGRAETLARDPALRGGAQAVAARSFGSPAVTAECAVGFLQLGGALVVSEPPAAGGPPDAGARWPAAGLAGLGFGAPTFVGAHDAAFVVIPKLSATEDRWPRRDGMPTKRPLWS